MKLSLEGSIEFLQVADMKGKDILGSKEVTKDSEKVLGTFAEMATQAGQSSIPRECHEQ